MYLNKAQIIGKLTRKPELKILPNGQNVCSFSVATNRVYKDASGQKQEQAEFHNITVFGKQAETSSQYLKKGQDVYVEGRIATRSWDKDGVKHYRTEIVAETVQFGSKNETPAPQVETVVPEGKGIDMSEFGEANFDDIPF